MVASSDGMFISFIAPAQLELVPLCNLSRVYPASCPNAPTPPPAKDDGWNRLMKPWDQWCFFMFYLFEKRSFQEVEIYLTCVDMSLDRFCSPRQIHVQPHLRIDFVCINTASKIWQQGTGSAVDVRVKKKHNLAIFMLQSFVFLTLQFNSIFDRFYTYGTVCYVFIHVHTIFPSFHHKVSC